MFYLTKFDVVTVFGNPKIAKSKLICISKIPRYFDRVGIHGVKIDIESELITHFS